MRIQDLFLRSNVELARVVDAIGDEQWDLPLPEHASWSPMDLRAAIAYHAYDDAWVPDVLAGKSAEQAGDAFDGLRASHDPRGVYVEQNRRASEAVRGFDDLDRVTHLSYGDFPAREFLQHITSFRTVRSYDLARLIGLEPDLPEDFLVGVEEEFAPHMTQYRDMGVFPPAKPVAPDASTQARVMAMFGRD